MTVVIPDETPADGDTSIVVAPVIVNDTATDDATDDAADDATEEVVEAVIEETVDLAVMVGNLSARVAALESAAIVDAIVEESEPDIVVNEEGDGDVIVTGDDSPVGVPWTHKRPSIFGGNG